MMYEDPAPTDMIKLRINGPRRLHTLCKTSSNFSLFYRYFGLLFNGVNL